MRRPGRHIATARPAGRQDGVGRGRRPERLVWPASSTPTVSTKARSPRSRQASDIGDHRPPPAEQAGRSAPGRHGADARAGNPARRAGALTSGRAGALRWKRGQPPGRAVTSEPRTATPSTRRSRVRSTRLSQIGVPAAVVAIVVMMSCRCRPCCSTCCWSAHLAGATVILLVSMHVRRALELLHLPVAGCSFATLFRLALNVSVTPARAPPRRTPARSSRASGTSCRRLHRVGLVIFLILSVIQSS